MICPKIKTTKISGINAPIKIGPRSLRKGGNMIHDGSDRLLSHFHHSFWC